MIIIVHPNNAKLFPPYPTPCLSLASLLPTSIFSPPNSAGTNKRLLQMQEDQFKEKGRYQENQENLAIFAIKERYMNAVPQCPVCNLLFITCLLVHRAMEVVALFFNFRFYIRLKVLRT